MCYYLVVISMKIELIEANAHNVSVANELLTMLIKTEKSYIEKNPNIIQGFTNAIYKGEQWVKSHSAKEIAEAIVDFFPDTDLSMLEAALQSYIDIDAWRDNPVLKQESFALLQKVMKEAGELEKEADYGKVVNNSFAEKAIQKLGK